jgi:hypothetical protein
MFIVEIEWAEDEQGNAIVGPVGPFESEGGAQAWGEELIYNGEWNTAQLRAPQNHEWER